MGSITKRCKIRNHEQILKQADELKEKDIPVS